MGNVKKAVCHPAMMDHSALSTSCYVTKAQILWHVRVAFIHCVITGQVGVAADAGWATYMSVVLLG